MSYVVFLIGLVVALLGLCWLFWSDLAPIGLATLLEGIALMFLATPRRPGSHG